MPLGRLDVACEVSRTGSDQLAKAVGLMILTWKMRHLELPGVLGRARKREKYSDHDQSAMRGADRAPRTRGAVGAQSQVGRTPRLHNTTRGA